MSRPSHPRLSVVLPAYNAGTALTRTVDELRAAVPAATELIVVDDGSTDGSVEPVASRDDVTVLRLPVNRGKGAALRCGLAAASGQHVAMMDADGQFDPDDLLALHHQLGQTSADAVVGTKLDAGSHWPVHRRVASRLFAGWVRLWLRLPVSETQVGLKVFTRDLLETALPACTEPGFAFDAELLTVAVRSGYGRIAGRPVTVRDGDRSTVTLRRTLQTLVAVVRVGLRQANLRHVPTDVASS